MARVCWQTGVSHATTSGAGPDHGYVPQHLAEREMQYSYYVQGTIHFRPLDDPTGVVPFYKHFGIDDYHSKAKPACRNPLDQLKENVELGKKMRFCCSGRPQGDDECCCGGWTHEKVCSLLLS